ncbi:hypothetical protein E0W68_09490 [Flavobacterium salilacus subsp. salilacus]|uniref:DUF6712 family protein n=1 Tax=Flavobacterium TaxID=237 RepID=UPI00107531D3|nr:MULTISPECIES: hypothetical protein [Flavobacterium]KAF2518247.1 hypothetical protein E0W68_09490 [Flavobacterium salilacus subsp. salilacus]MBE1615343.1 hypothetical protein [Flavobacterium sp. SaA2.13]
MMQPLITRNDIAQYKQISKTPNDAKLNEMILDAQLLDIQPLLGEKLFNAVMASPEDFTVLLEGGIYEKDGISYTNYGLKMVLSYFTYARYMMFASVTDTPFSVVEKLNSDSRPVEATTKKTIYQLNRDAAYKVWESVHNWLVRTNNEEYKKNCGVANTNQGMRFTKIG